MTSWGRNPDERAKPSWSQDDGGTMPGPRDSGLVRGMALVLVIAFAAGLLAVLVRG